jgi:hypothetical protein
MPVNPKMYVNMNMGLNPDMPCAAGPFAPPVLGNLIAISRMDLIAFIDHCRQKYGKIFKVCCRWPLANWLWHLCRLMPTTAALYCYTVS